MSVDFHVLREKFLSIHGSEPALYRAPGRVNLIGEHTDYNAGFVMPMNTALYTGLAIRLRSDRVVKIHSMQFDETVQFSLDQVEPGGHAPWAEYIKGVAHVLEREGFGLSGADMLIDGDIPLGGGLSSSASLEAVVAFALLDSSGLKADAMKIASMCQRAEHEFAGVPCGIMDQAVIAGCPRGHAMKLDCRSLESGFIRLPDELCVLVVDSGVRHQLSDGGYRQRRGECDFAVQVLASHDPAIDSLRDASPQLVEQFSAELGELPYRRARHVVSENQRVHDAETAIAGDDLAVMGRILNASHASLRDDFMVSCRELDFLVETASACSGVYGARMVGGGFGGCAIALVDPGVLDEVTDHIIRAYADFSGQAPWHHVVQPADPAGRYE